MAIVNAIKNNILSMVSHDLRTPLTSIQLYAQMLQDEIETLSRQRFVLDLEQSRRTSAELLARFSIGADRSPLHDASASSE